LELKNFFVQDDQGNKLPGAICYLYVRGTESLAAGLQKANGMGLLNPFNADQDGLVQLAAANGLYDLRVVKDGRDNRIQVQFNDVTDDLATAQAAADRSEAARDVAQLSAGLKDDIAHGLATTTPGQHFSVAATHSDGFLTLYKNDAGAAVRVGEYPSASAVASVRDRIGDSSKVVLAVTDDAGYTGLEVTPTSFKTSDLELSTERLRMGDQSFERSNGHALAVVDDFGFVGYMLPLHGESKTAELPGFTADAILQANQKALASAAGVLREYNTEVARPIWDYNHFAEYGQSLSTGFEGWPALSKTPKFGNLMLGDSVRPASRTAGAFTPIGSATLTPLKAVVHDAGSGATILSDEEVAALAPGAGNEGEATVIGMTNLAKKLHNQRLQVLNDQTRSFVASCCGVAGQPIERLIKGDSTNRWQRLTQATEKVKAVALAEGKTYGLVGVSFLQGEFNYRPDWGGVVTVEEYKQKLATLYADIEADIVAAIAEQSQPPLFLTYQTGASYTSDQNNLAIGMAQWELSNERPNWVLATPVYPYPDKGGHLTSNSYRWVGKQFAKVWHRVVELGQNWKPLSPLQAEVKGREALITFHVPHPPLAFDTPYVGRTATNYLNKGFTALDNGGALDIEAVTIPADCVVQLVFARDPIGPVYIRYADKTTHNGNGCLRDSDPTVSDDVYEFTAGGGQYADENIPALVGKPYPLHNWCIAFHIPAVGAE
jgi:hypothetical protein